jgi:hypothetical protein
MIITLIINSVIYLKISFNENKSRKGENVPKQENFPKRMTKKESKAKSWTT